MFKVTGYYLVWC